MTYRGAEIYSSRVMDGWYDWYHPLYADVNEHGDGVWCGGGKTVEDCVYQIDEWFERYEHLNN